MQSAAVLARKKFREDALSRWESLLRSIFPKGIPTQCRWDALNDIIGLLATIGAVELTNYLFVPQGGGVDITGADRSAEEGCVEIHHGQSAIIAKPSTFFVESFGEDKLEWAYFRLETKPLAPSGVYETVSDTHEEVTHLGKGKYVPRSVWDQGNLGYDEENGDEIPLPPEARPTFRTLRGSFVIFAKVSIYNSDPETSDARHDKMSGEQFRRAIRQTIDTIEEELSEAKRGRTF